MSREESELKKPKEPTPEELAAQKQKEADIKKAEEERRQTGAFWSQLDWSIQYNLNHGWGKWTKIDGSPDPVAPAGPEGWLSSEPGALSLLKEGTYEYESKFPHLTRLHAHYSLNSETGAHEVRISINNVGLSRHGIDSSVLDPKTPSEFNTHAETTARMSAKFLAQAGFGKLKLTIPKDCAFREDLGDNWGSNTLQYQKLYLKSALDQCIREGIGFDDSDPQVKKLLQIISNKSSNEGQKFQEMIQKANARGDARKAYNEFVNPKVIQGYRDQLRDAEKVNPEEQKKLTEDIEQAIKAKEKQIKELTEQLKAPALASSEADKLKAELAEANRLLKHQRGFQTDLAKVATNDELYDVQARFEQFKNPNQHLSDAIRDVKEMLVKILPDKANFTPADMDLLNKFKAEIERIEKKLASPMSDAERADEKEKLKAAIDEARKINNPDFKEKAPEVLNKAEKLADGKKTEMANNKRLDDRVSRLEKAMESLEKAQKGYEEAIVIHDPKNDEDAHKKGANKLVGMVIDKRLGKLVKLTTPEDAKKYVEKQYKKLEGDRDELKDAFKTEKAKLDVKADDLKKSSATDADKKKAAEIKERLRKVEERFKELEKAPAATATTAPTPGGGTVK